MSVTISQDEKERGTKEKEDFPILLFIQSFDSITSLMMKGNQTFMLTTIINGWANVCKKESDFFSKLREIKSFELQANPSLPFLAYKFSGK